MNIRASRGGRAGDRLVSWKTAGGDPSPGSFAYGIDPVTSLQLLTWNGSSPLWRSGAWTGYRVATDFIAHTSTVVYLTVLDIEDDASMSFTLSPGAPRTRYVMSHSGELVLQSWNGASLEWDELAAWPPYECSHYGHCGPFGYCDNTVAAPTCKCLDGFEPASGEWSSGRFSQGCRRRAALRCGDGDGFLALPAMKAPDRFVVVGNRSFDECAAECSRNCSCVAFACLVWVGELIDAEKIGGNVAGSETLHLRLAGLDKGRRMGRKTVKTVSLVLASILLTCISLLILWIYKCKGLKKKRGKHKMLILGNLSDPEGFGEGSPTEGYQFPVVSFRDITAATDNFHESYMIGQGGFEKVYKAKLDGQEVAIKRLSRDSKQRTVEFRNEVILIAKLQHRNLVKFLGCCVEGDEKLLIFEYMPNKSLDALLFKEMKPKIADFGMARMFNNNQLNANTKQVAGTYGYMAPEYAMRGIFSAKSDVYSFGVLVLELVSGVKISCTDQIMEFEDLIDYAWNLWKEGKANNLGDQSIVESCIPDEVMLCIHIGLLCVQDNPNDRPLMSSVLFVLENGSTTLPKPKKPVYFAHTNNEVEQRRGN
ncbi:hypothetical protein PAHAL_2G358700 [Panicum hallii]|uniref:non-specific serine/threonine protein kinase n=1 Tax=Panicum hallii TaxID=206008 RepID=A0A2T8KRL1_9POAL|nr:hypothetical protein PAHAL_2G358700 [Panicum hallii]